MNYVLIGIIILVLIHQIITNIKLSKKNLALEVTNNSFTGQLKELHIDVTNLQDELGGEREKNRALLSQKKSSETRLGQISEHLVPFLENCKHEPKNMHFMGNPIDYIVFDFEEPKIVFLEVKSGNSKPSKRQKLVKNCVKTGRVFYEEIRINEKGIKNKTVGSDEGIVESADVEEVDDDGQD